MADIRTNDAPAAALAAPPSPAQPAAAHADPAAAAAQHDRPAERLDGQPAPPPAGPLLDADQQRRITVSDSLSMKPNSHTASEWDRMPAELQDMILAWAGPLTQLLSRRWRLSVFSEAEVRRLWADVFDLDWNGDLDQLQPARTLQMYMWYIRTRSMFERMSGIMPQRLELHGWADRVALRNGWLDLVSDTRQDQLHRTAFEAELPLAGFERLVRSGHILVDAELVNGAALHGRTDLLEWLDANNDILTTPESGSCWTTDAMDYAAGKGNLDTVKWLDAHRTEGCTTDAMDLAARGGHFECLVWLHLHRSEGCTNAAMDEAARGGHLDCVEWLHNNRAEGCTTAAMDLAAESGHLDMIVWLHNNRDEGCTFEAMDRAALHGHMHVLEWMRQNRTEGCTLAAMNGAVWGGHLDVVQWLIEHGTENDVDHAVQAAAEFGLQDIFEFLVPLSSPAALAGCIRAAARAQSTAILEWLVARHADVVGAMIESFDFDVPVHSALDYLRREFLSHFTDRGVFDLISAAVDQCQFRALLWFRSRFPNVVASHPVSRAGLCPADEVFSWIDKRCPRVPIRALHMAIHDKRIDVIEWLLEHFGDRAHNFPKRRARAAVARLCGAQPVVDAR
ncbi:hypothetical protein HK105_208628 [Polyrhizophydium stewartii]|uniref:Ankyrin repeat protein n=1 Tax=Polyrhizophydium stewartii TaxID=2732419 RepID=A0ABR4MXA3_9FUNG